MKTHHKLYSTTTMFKVYLASKKKKTGRSKAAVLAVGHKRTARGEGGGGEEGGEGLGGACLCFAEKRLSARAQIY